jgi:hypothetical protein
LRRFATLEVSQANEKHRIVACVEHGLRLQMPDQVARAIEKGGFPEAAGACATGGAEYSLEPISCLPNQDVWSQNLLTTEQVSQQRALPWRLAPGASDMISIR